VNSSETSDTAPAVAGPASRIDWCSWRVPIALALIVLLTGALYWPSTQSLLHEWFDIPSSAYRHGSLIVVIAVWLLMRSAVGESPPATAWSKSLVPVSLLAVASLAWLIALRAGIQVGHQLLLPIIIWLAILSVFGRRLATSSIVPVGLLYSAVPVWHVTVPALQAMTVSVVSLLLRVVGIPAYVTGDYVHIRSGVFHIEQGCAGLHYFIVAATIAVLFGELREDRRGTRLYLVGLAIALALVSNWLRVFIIIVAGDLTDMQHYLVRVDHSVFGWVVFAVAMAVFLLLGRRRPLDPIRAAHPQSRARARTFAPVYLLGALAAAIGPGWMLVMPVRVAAAPNVSAPAGVDGWAGQAGSCRGRWRPQYPAADLTSKIEFTRGRQAVCFYSATYLSQHQDKELIGYFSSIYDPDSEVVSSVVRQAAGRTVNEIQLGSETAADRIVWYAYVVGEREIRRGIEAQLRYALGTLHGAPASSVYAISAPCRPDCAAARAALNDFLPHVRVGMGTVHR